MELWSESLHCIAFSLVAFTLHLLVQFLQPLGNVHTQILLEVWAQVTEDNKKNSEWYCGVKDHVEGFDIGLLDGATNCGNDFRRNSRHSGEVTCGDTSKKGGN